jgi:NAD(P)-dependent dehydrogenase (short-subunit alcohol dehydrogenase family)
VDILYNNASALRNGPLMALSDEDWHFTIKNELDIVWFSVRAAWPKLVARGGGSIVNVASIAARFGARFAGQVPHGSAKGGVLAMTKHLCAAGGALGIRANAILPGLIYTPETAPAWQLMYERSAGYGGTWGKIRETIRPDSNVSHTRIEWLLVDDPWFRGRVIVIGDAAHACPPLIARGPPCAPRTPWSSPSSSPATCRPSRRCRFSCGAGCPGSSWWCATPCSWCAGRWGSSRTPRRTSPAR